MAAGNYGGRISLLTCRKQNFKRLSPGSRSHTQTHAPTQILALFTQPHYSNRLITAFKFQVLTTHNFPPYLWRPFVFPVNVLLKMCFLDRSVVSPVCFLSFVSMGVLLFVCLVPQIQAESPNPGSCLFRLLCWPKLLQ